MVVRGCIRVGRKLIAMGAFPVTQDVMFCQENPELILMCCWMTLVTWT